MDDAYRTILAEDTSILKVDGSRFLARALPVESIASADLALEETRRMYRDATHHCFAYRLGTAGMEVRFSDDGEPSGTAGKPILTAIRRHDLTNILVIVTRYFGGTKLGTGGLARAYGGAAESLLAKAETVTRFVTKSVSITFPHDQIGNVMHCISKSGARIEDTTYDDDVHLNLSVRESLIDQVRKQLVEATSGNINFTDDRR